MSKLYGQEKFMYWQIEF